MVSLFNLISMLIGFVMSMMVFYGVFSLLISFGMLSPYGRLAGPVWNMLNGLFEPLLTPLRRIIPPYRGFDWSFLVLYALLYFIQSLLHEYGPHAIVVNVP